MTWQLPPIQTISQSRYEPVGALRRPFFFATGSHRVRSPSVRGALMSAVDQDEEFAHVGPSTRIQVDFGRDRGNVARTPFAQKGSQCPIACAENRVHEDFLESWGAHPRT